jgi:hypothetical protein
MAGLATSYQSHSAHRWQASSSCLALATAAALLLLLPWYTATHGSSIQAAPFGRRLKQAAAKPAPASAKPAAAKPACKWQAEDNSCNPTNQAWVLATKGGRGLPSSPYRRAVMLASGRDERCQRSNSPAACAKQVKDRCFWQPGRGNGTDGGSCMSSDLQELLLWSSKVRAVWAARFVVAWL